jgi:nucleoside-diphosphate-sugar epimerase
MHTTRRRFIQSTAAAAIIGPMALAQRQPDPKPKPDSKKLRLLILGGTGFLGPAIVEQAQKDGHSLTLFNRGQREKVKDTFFKDAEHLYGNRDPKKHADEDEDKEGFEGEPKSSKGLTELEAAVKSGKKWDAVIDTSGFYPRMVKASAQLLAPAAASYLFISTVSVYKSNDKPGADESAELATIDDPTVETMGAQFQNYGPLKVLCEKEVEAAFPARACVVRPGYIVGIRDDSDRFSYWPVRTSEVGELLTPGDPKDPVQYIDVRDLAIFILRCITTNARGSFDATSPSMPWGNVISACVAATKGLGKNPAKPLWVPNDWLASNGLEPGSLPIYIPAEGEYAGFHQRNVGKAVAAGMTIRPCEQTCTEILNWWPGEVERRYKVAKERKDQGKRVRPTDLERNLSAGPPREKQDELVKKWKDEKSGPEKKEDKKDGEKK